jgi:hypothetical protein
MLRPRRSLKTPPKNPQSGRRPLSGERFLRLQVIDVLPERWVAQYSDRAHPAGPSAAERPARADASDLEERSDQTGRPNVLQQQARFDAFVERYDAERPHQVLAMKDGRVSWSRGECRRQLQPPLPHRQSPDASRPQSSRQRRREGQGHHLRPRVSANRAAARSCSGDRRDHPSALSIDLEDPAPARALRRTGTGGQRRSAEGARAQDDPTTPGPCNGSPRIRHGRSSANFKTIACCALVQSWYSSTNRPA